MIKKVNVFFKNRKIKENKKSDIRIVAEALLIAMLLRSFVVQPFTIPSGSMYPTLMVGDYLFVTKYSYGYSRYSLPFGGYWLPDLGRIFSEKPKQGDVAVFRHKGADLDYIKRVVGMPGDTVQLKYGRVYINDKLLARTRLPDTVIDGISVATYEETLPNGVKHIIWETAGDNGFADNTIKFIVPQGSYFMMGNNRDESNDSRFSDVGAIELDAFVGPARVIAFSLDSSPIWKFWNWYSNGRGDRIGKSID